MGPQDSIRKGIKRRHGFENPEGDQPTRSVNSSKSDFRPTALPGTSFIHPNPTIEWLRNTNVFGAGGGSQALSEAGPSQHPYTNTDQHKTNITNPSKQRQIGDLAPDRSQEWPQQQAYQQPDYQASAEASTSIQSLGNSLTQPGFEGMTYHTTADSSLHHPAIESSNQASSSHHDIQSLNDPSGTQGTLRDSQRIGSGSYREKPDYQRLEHMMSLNNVFAERNSWMELLSLPDHQHLEHMMSLNNAFKADSEQMGLSAVPDYQYTSENTHNIIPYEIPIKELDLSFRVAEDKSQLSPQEVNAPGMHLTHPNKPSLEVHIPWGIIYRSRLSNNIALQIKETLNSHINGSININEIIQAFDQATFELSYPSKINNWVVRIEEASLR